MEQKPDCFGILDKVFPISESGIREVKSKCIECPFRIECLKSALDSEEGIKMKEEMLKRHPVHGVGDWIKRWSEKKMLNMGLDKDKKEGIWSNIWSNFKKVMFFPKLFFLSVKDIELKDAFIFAIFMGSIGSMFSMFWKLVILADKFPSLMNILQQNSIGSMDIIIFFSFFSIPLVVILGLIIYSFVIHIFLSAFGAAKGGIKKTFFVICYSQAPEILSFIPMLGGIIAFVWRSVLQIIGLKYIHKTSYAKVIISFLIPLFIFFASMMIIMSSLYHIISRVFS